MKASRSRPTYRYERVLTGLGIAIAVAMVASGLFVAGFATVILVASSHSGSNK